MIATISGQAGFAVVPGETTAFAYSIDGPGSPDEILPEHVDLLFRGATDIVQVDVADASAAIALLRTEWSRDRLLQMLLLLLREDGEDEARRLAAGVAEELFESNAARRFALNRLYSHPLTEDANVHAAIDIANMAGARNTSSRLRQLRDDQLSIARVSMEWKSILTVMPEINREGRLRCALEASDIFYRLGRTQRTSDLDDLKISLAPSDLPQRFARVVNHLINAQRRAVRPHETPPVRSYSPFEHSYAQILVDNVPLIDKIVMACARPYRLDRDDVEDLAATVKLALVENDYAILRKYQGRSSLSTYLSSVCRRLMLDNFRHEWGRWYPSARATRMGEDAVRFERLVWRDAYTIEEASRKIAESFREISPSRLAKLLDLAPRSGRPLLVAMPEDVPDRGPLVHQVLMANEVQRSLQAAVELLPSADRELVMMRFWEDRPVREIASALNITQRETYKKLSRVLRILRQKLEGAGLHREALETFAERSDESVSLRLVQSMYERLE